MVNSLNPWEQAQKPMEKRRKVQQAIFFLRNNLKTAEDEAEHSFYIYLNMLWKNLNSNILISTIDLISKYINP